MINKNEVILTKEQQDNINLFVLKSSDEKSQYYQHIAQKLNILTPSKSKLATHQTRHLFNSILNNKRKKRYRKISSAYALSNSYTYTDCID